MTEETPKVEVTVAEKPSYILSPRDDITAYEVALILAKMQMIVQAATFETFAPELQRHFALQVTTK